MLQLDMRAHKRREKAPETSKEVGKGRETPLRLAETPSRGEMISPQGW